VTGDGKLKFNVTFFVIIFPMNDAELYLTADEDWAEIYCLKDLLEQYYAVVCLIGKILYGVIPTNPSSRRKSGSSQKTFFTGYRPGFHRGDAPV
jgi:hypothetical protein